MDDIIIERPTAENLVKYYDQYITILDHWKEVNRDVYKEKRWDVDAWNFSSKCVDYIPHAWDVLLSDYVNGIGFKDDLKVEIIDDSITTDVTIYFYKKQIDYLNDYIKNNNVKENFTFNLKRYNNNITTKNVKYRITASDAKKIDTDNISLKALEERTGTFTVNIQDVLAPNYDSSNLIETDYSKLDSNYIPKLVSGRVDQLRFIASKWRPIKRHDRPYTIFIHGSSGVGKTICVRHSVMILNAGLPKGNFVDLIEINCMYQTSELAIIKKILNHYNIKFVRGFSIDY
jgi:hypothetical protein